MDRDLELLLEQPHEDEDHGGEDAGGGQQRQRQGESEGAAAMDVDLDVDVGAVGKSGGESKLGGSSLLSVADDGGAESGMGDGPR